MPTNCCVPKCGSRIGGHTFPLNTELRNVWIQAIKRAAKKATDTDWYPTENDVVCFHHFIKTDYKPKLCDAMMQKKLKDGVIPTVFSFKKQVKKRKTKNSLKSSIQQTKFNDSNSENVIVNFDELLERAEQIVTVQESDFGECEEISVMDYESSSAATFVDADFQCTILTQQQQLNFLRLDLLKQNDTAIHYYTGFSNYNQFQFFFRSLGPAAVDLNYKPLNLSPEEQLFIALLKLRQGKENKEIAILYNISANVASKIFYNWINFMFFQLQELNTWPTKEVVLEHMPKSFRESFQTTRVILDATEIEIEKPTNVNSQSSPFSTYKNKNTLKSMIGITPNGNRVRWISVQTEIIPKQDKHFKPPMVPLTRL
ncbi:uncharacterized protein LOC108950672 [Ciona intestinalis]